jgi:transposase
MEYLAGLDVSLEETSICIVDSEGRIIVEKRVASQPAAIAEALRSAELP